MAPVFPFSAIVGQDEMKLALLIAAVDPSVGGVLVFGDRGTGKSTAVRALAALLPAMKVVAGCPYNCDPDANIRCPHCATRKSTAPKAKNGYGQRCDLCNMTTVSVSTQAVVVECNRMSKNDACYRRQKESYVVKSTGTAT